tara:strand:+ start:286 stop:450 length:165 start_codon:yes stop_codon:yes gene_type:complete
MLYPTNVRNSVFMGHRLLILAGGLAGLYAARNIQCVMGELVTIEIVNCENYFVF